MYVDSPIIASHTMNAFFVRKKIQELLLQFLLKGVVKGSEHLYTQNFKRTEKILEKKQKIVEINYLFSKTKIQILKSCPNVYVITSFSSST